MKKQIPNLFTLLNLVFGCFAILMVFQHGLVMRSYDTGEQYVEVPEKIFMASFFILMAAVVDFFDGFVARMLKSTSPLGAQLDSLADVVSFGVAPSMILCQFLMLGLAEKSGAFDSSAWWLIPVFIPAAAAAYRLAKFNLDTEQSIWFKGLPTPAAGLLTASLPLIYWNASDAFTLNLIKEPVFIISYSLLISAVMISNLPLMSMKFSKDFPKLNTGMIALIAVSGICLIALKWLAAPAIFLSYIIISLIFKKVIR